MSRVRSRVFWAPPTVAWTVRSTASRTASGSSLGVVRRLAIRSSQSSISWAACPGLRSTCVPLRSSPTACSFRAIRTVRCTSHRRLLDKPLMFNHHRGLWGYSGTARDGAPLTVQSTGMGGASAAIVTEELIGLGAATLVRIGTCGALVDEIELGTLLPVDAAIAADGASRALGADGRVAADEALAAALARATERAPVTCVSTDLFYDAREDLPDSVAGRRRDRRRDGGGRGDAGGPQPRSARRPACSR